MHKPWQHIYLINFWMCNKKLYLKISCYGIIGLTGCPISSHLKCRFSHSEMPEQKSVIKMIQYNHLPELSHTLVFLNIRHSNMFVSALHLPQLLCRKNKQLFIILLLIFCTSFPGSENVVLLNTLDLFKCDIPIFIFNFAWKHRSC